MSADVDFNVDAIINEIEAIVSDTVESATRFIVVPFVKRMPRDTGHARRNVQLGIGAPNLQELPGVDFDGSSTVTNALTKLALRGRDNGFRPIFITNNVPYILPLAGGSSLQAPDGWIDNIIDKAVKRLAAQTISGLQLAVDDGDFF